MVYECNIESQLRSTCCIYGVGGAGEFRLARSVV